jgi:hypothetical protein
MPNDGAAATKPLRPNVLAGLRLDELLHGVQERLAEIVRIRDRMQGAARRCARRRVGPGARCHAASSTPRWSTSRCGWPSLQAPRSTMLRRMSRPIRPIPLMLTRAPIICSVLTALFGQSQWRARSRHAPTVVRHPLPGANDPLVRQ